MEIKEKKSKEILERLKNDRMYRTFTNLKVRQEEIEDDQGHKNEEMIVEGQAEIGRAHV